MTEVLEGVAAPGGVNYGDFTFRVKGWVLTGLADAAAVALPASAANPALGCFRVRAGEGFLELAATDMERTVLAASAAVAANDRPDGTYHEAYIPAKRLQAILKEAPEGDVTVRVRKNQAEVTAGGSWTLSLPDASSYPDLISIADKDFTDVEREKFLNGIRSVRHVVSKDAGRPPLTQAEVRTDPNDAERTVITASDGSRFARAVIEGFPPPCEPLCIPSSALDDLGRLLAGGQSDHAGIALTEDYMIFKVGAVILAVARRSTPFPDVDRLLLQPALADNDQVLSVDKGELAAAVRRVRINADGETSAIVLGLEANTVDVVSRDKGGNSALEGVVAGWEGNKRTLCVNHAYLSEMLAAHPGNSVQFKLGKDIGKRRSQILLQGDGITQVLSQMIPSLVGY